MTFVSGAIRLRKAVPSDAQGRLALGNDPGIAEMFGVGPDDLKPITPETALAWAEALMEHPHAWVIEDADRLIGEIRLDHVDSQDRRASLAIALYDPASLGKGVGTQAMRLVLAHAFEILRLHRISVRVLAYNARAIAAYKKCGFVEEGREREAAFVNGHWHDDVMMGLLEEEFRSRPA